jgi:predicted lipoprotein with Yx(FWY)xxD motif
VIVSSRPASPAVSRPGPSGSRRLVLGVAVVVAGLVTSACGATSTNGGGAVSAGPSATTSASASESSQTSPPTAPPVAAGVALTVRESDFGPMLFDEPGQAIYLFEVETDGRPQCYGECAAAWPPVLTTGAPQATNGVQADLLGTVARDDGSAQVTYGGHPLYFYAHEGPGQVLCHDVVENGGRWLVVTPEGTPAPA